MSTHPEAAAIVAANQANVWRYLRFLGADAATADDLTQETFLALLRGAFEERSPAATAAFLRAVARNLLLQSLRSRGRVVTTEAELEAADAAWGRAREEERGEERRDALRECLAALGERARRALDLQYAQRRSGEEIASALGITHANVRVVLHRAKQALQRCVEKTLGGTA